MGALEKWLDGVDPMSIGEFADAQVAARKRIRELEGQRREQREQLMALFQASQDALLRAGLKEDDTTTEQAFGRLGARIAELEAENAELKARVAELETIRDVNRRSLATVNSELREWRKLGDEFIPDDVRMPYPGQPAAIRAQLLGGAPFHQPTLAACQKVLRDRASELRRMFPINSIPYHTLQAAADELPAAVAKEMGGGK